MFDVLPPNESPEPRRVQRRASQSSVYASSQQKRKNKQPSVSRPQTVRLDWKLPARLRKPVREQLAQERQKRKERDAIVRFERKAIRTQPLLIADKKPQPQPGGVKLPSRRIFNRGVEHHTGDVYRHAKPKLQLASPPYVGSFAGGGYSGERKTWEHPSSRTVTSSPKKTKKPVSLARQVQRRIPQSIVSPERDVPYQMPATYAPEVSENSLFAHVPEVKESNKISLPFHFNIWPKFLWSKGTQSSEGVKKKSKIGQKKAE